MPIARPTQIDHVQPSIKAKYKVLTTAPLKLLEQLAINHVEERVEELFAIGGERNLTGQQTVDLLELAAYADIMCHPIEYPLRKACLKRVRAQMENSNVKHAIEWIRNSYECSISDETLPLGFDNDMLQESVSGGMREYATKLACPL